MSAADALKAARAAGIQLGVDGEDLALTASVPPPATVIDLLAGWRWHRPHSHGRPAPPGVRGGGEPVHRHLGDCEPGPEADGVSRRR